MGELMKFLNARRSAYHTNPKLIDEVIYTPYAYQPAQDSSSHDRPSSTNPRYSQTGDLLGIPELTVEMDAERRTSPRKKGKFYATSTEAEVFLFEYGTVVIWGMTEAQEKRFLSSMYAYEQHPPLSSELPPIHQHHKAYQRGR